MNETILKSLDDALRQNDMDKFDSVMKEAASLKGRDRVLLLSKVTQEAPSAEFLKKLLAAGMDIRSKTKGRQTLLHLAVCNEHAEVLGYVLTLGLDIEAKDVQGMTPLCYAASNASNVESLKKLVATGANIGYRTKAGKNLLHCAACNGHIEIVEFVLSLGFKIDMKGPDGMTALCYAACNNGNVEVLKKLIAAGADVRYKTQMGETLLHFAAKNDCTEVLDFVLSLGLDLEAEDTWGMTALCRAAWFAWNVEPLKKLVAAGADIHHKTEKGETLLYLAAESRSSDALEYLLSLGLDLEEEDEAGLTALCRAAIYQDAACLKNLVAAGADVQHKTRDGKTLLHLATRNANLQALDYILTLGLDLEAEDDEGMTALCYVAKDFSGYREFGDLRPLHDLLADCFGHSKEVLKRLVAAGADVNHKTKDGQTPRQLASGNGNQQILDFLGGILD